MLSNKFYKVSITSIPKPDKYSTKKEKRKENHRPISLMNINGKILKKMLANWIQQYSERCIYHNQVEFMSGMQGWFTIHKSINVIHNINKLKSKTHMIIPVDDKTQHPFIIKQQTILNKVDTEATFLNIIKTIHDKPIANIFPVRSWKHFL